MICVVKDASLVIVHAAQFDRSMATIVHAAQYDRRMVTLFRVVQYDRRMACQVESINRSPLPTVLPLSLLLQFFSQTFLPVFTRAMLAFRLGFRFVLFGSAVAFRDGWSRWMRQLNVIGSNVPPIDAVGASADRRY